MFCDGTFEFSAAITPVFSVTLCFLTILKTVFAS